MKSLNRDAEEEKYRLARKVSNLKGQINGYQGSIECVDEVLNTEK